MDENVTGEVGERMSFSFGDFASAMEFSGTGFREISGHLVTTHQIPSPMFKGDQEMGPEGIVEGWGGSDFTKPGLYLCPAGTPHHSPFAFGWWHINAVDEFRFWAPGPDNMTTFLIIEKVREGAQVDKIAWYCQSCSNLLHTVVHESGKHRDASWDGIINAEGKAVQEFNADESLRTCDKCGAVHPLAYRLMGNPPNSPEEEAARATW